MSISDSFFHFQQNWRQLRSKWCQIPQRSLFSTAEPNSTLRLKPQRRNCNKLKPRIQTRKHRRRHPLLSSLHQRKSFASIFSDSYQEDKLFSVQYVEKTFFVL